MFGWSSGGAGVTSVSSTDFLKALENKIPPHPWWYQPVWVPIAISCGLILLGRQLHRNRAPGLT